MKSKTALADYRNCRARVLQKLSFTVLASGALLAGPTGRAATDTFIGSVPNPTFANGFNAVPANGDTLVFGPAGSGGTTVSNGGALTVGAANTDGIDFLASASAYTISGSAITLASSGTGIGVNDLSRNAQTINAPLALASAQTFNVANMNGALNVGAISGAFTLTKAGAGLLSLGSGTSFANLVVLGGTVQAGGDNNLGASGGTITLDGGTLRTNFGNNQFTYNIASNRAVKLGDAGANTGGAIDTGNGSSSFGGVLANNGGTNSFTKTGNGTLTLTGANTYTGTTFVNLGLLTLDYNGKADAGAATGTAIINSASALVIGGTPTVLGAVPDSRPGFFAQGASGGARTQTFNGLTLNAAANLIGARGFTGASSNMTLAFGAITHNAGGTVAFSNVNSGTATAQGIFTTTNVNDASGILGGYAVINSVAGGVPNSGNFQAPTDYATVNGSGQIVAYTGYNVVGTSTLASLTTNNDRVTAAGGVTLSVGTGTTDINTLSNGAGATGTTTVNIATGGVLRLGANGGVMTANGTGSINFSGGTLTAGGAANAPGEISFIQGGNNDAFTLDSVIADNGTGAVTVTFSQYNSQGNTRFNGANTYSGGTYLNSGRILDNASTGFGTGPVYVAPNAQAYLTYGGTIANNFFISGASQGNQDTPSALRFNGGQTLSGTITLVGDAQIAIRGSTGNFITGQVTGPYNLTIGDNNGFGSITLSNPGNNFGGRLNINNEEVILGAAGVIPDNSPVDFTNGGSTLTLNGFNETIGGILNDGGNNTARFQASENGSNKVSTLTDNQAFSSTFNGILRNSNSGSGNVLAFVKGGAGTLTLAPSFNGNLGSAYTGGTTINGGTIRLGVSSTSTFSALGAQTGALTVNNGGTLDLFGFNQTVGALGGTAGGVITNSGTAASTLTAGDATNSTFAGSIQNGANGGGTVAFNKQGGGTLDLTGANTYTGATNVTAGGLQIGFGGSLNAASVTTLSGTASLILGDGAGQVSQTFNSLTTTSTTPVVGGAAGIFSTLTLNNAGTSTFANIFGGAGTNQNNLNVVVAGTGTTPTAIFTGQSTYTGFTQVNAGSTLNLAGGSIGGSALTLNAGATLTGSGNNSTTGVVGSLTAAGGSAITLTGAGGTALRSSGAITLGNTGSYGAGNYTTLNYTLAGMSAVEALNTPVALTLNSGGAYVNVTNPTTLGTYTLANYGSLAGTGSFSLSSTTPNVTMLSLGRNQEKLTTNATSLVLTISGTPSPNVAFFNDAVNAVFNDTTTSSTMVNFSTNRAGTTDAGNVPSANTDVVLVADNAADNQGSSDVTATLGASTTINSLTAIAPHVSPVLLTETSFTLAADGSTLTIAGLGDTNTSSDGTYTGNAAGNGILLAAGAAPLTVNVPVVIGTAGANQTWTNNSGSDLTLGGTVTGSATGGATQTLTLTNTATGNMVFLGALADGTTGKLALLVNSPGAGAVTLNAASTYSGGTTVNAGILTATAAGGLGTGSVTVNPTNATGSAADNATLNTTGSIAATAAVTVNSEAGDGGFGVGTINFNGATPTIGSLAGNGSVVLNNAGGTSLTIGSTNNLSGTFAGVISQGAGAGSLVKAGTGTETLSGANTYTGTTTINAGTLAVGNAQALGAPTTASVIFGAGSTGTLQLNGNNVTVVDLNTNVTTVGTPVIASGSATAGTDTLTVNTANTDTFAGTLQNGGTRLLALTKSGAGTLTLTGTNTYSGGTTVTGGTLATTDNVNAFGTNGAGTTVAIGSAGTVLLNATNSNTYQDTFSGSGLLKFNFTSGGGDVVANNFNNFIGTIELSAPNGATGNKLQIQSNVPTALSNSTLQIDNNAQYFTGGNVNFGTIKLVGTGNNEGRGAIRLNGNGTTSGVIGGNVLLQGNATIGNEGGALTGNIATGVAGTSILTMGTGFSNGAALLSGNISDGVGTLALTTANGTTILTGASTYTGATTISAGSTLRLGTGAAGNDGTISGTSGIANNGALIYNRFGSATSNRVISGTGTVTKTGAGNQTLTGANTYGGGTTITAGALLVNNTSGSGTGTGAVAVNAGGTLGGGNGAVFNGALITQGTGGNTATSQTYVSGVLGVVSGGVTVASGGTLAPGNSVGTLTLGSLTMAAGSLATYEFNGTANDFTAIAANGTLTLSGGRFTLLQEGSQNAFAAGGIYNLFGYAGGTFTGDTANLSVANTQPGVTYNFVNDTTDSLIQLQIIAPVPEPGTWALLAAGLGVLGYSRRRRAMAAR